MYFSFLPYVLFKAAWVSQPACRWHSP